MRLIAGVDIGNSTTEVCVGELDVNGNISFPASSSCPTTGTKGTVVNVHGIKAALKEALSKMGKDISDLSLIRLNEAAPVIGDTAMETLTETVITDSSMIGHNPATPAGAGQAVGKLINISRIAEAEQNTPYILVVSSAPKQSTDKTESFTPPKINLSKGFCLLQCCIILFLISCACPMYTCLYSSNTKTYIPHISLQSFKSNICFVFLFDLIK